jgi:hypothetical protein
MEANNDPKALFWLRRANVEIEGEPKLRDVCQACNNGVLSRLDAYICELFDLISSIFKIMIGYQASDFISWLDTSISPTIGRSWAWLPGVITRSPSSVSNNPQTLFLPHCAANPPHKRPFLEVVLIS